MHRKKIPSFSSLVGLSSRDSPKEKDQVSAAESSDPGSMSDSDDERKSRGSKSRLSSYFARSRSPSPAAKRVVQSEDEEDDEDDDDDDYLYETDSDAVCPSNAFVDTEQDDDTSDDDAWDELEKNTEANTGLRTTDEILLQQDINNPDEGPNIIHKVLHNPFSQFTPRRKKTTGAGGKKEKEEALYSLEVGKPIFERNRATIVLTHGHPDDVAKHCSRTRTYLVASDLSEESLYAIEWTIGTVLRNGDECIIISAMETDTKFDPDPSNHNLTDKLSRMKYQKDRQEMALRLSREAIALLERTRLDVRVTCQAIHTKNARHMLIDIIDYLEPTMVVIGSRGLSAIKGMLLGSVSNYLIQKSSVPVMVARRRLRRRQAFAKPKSMLNHNARVPLEQATIEKETTKVHEEGETSSGKESSASQRSSKQPSSVNKDNDDNNSDDPGAEGEDERDNSLSKVAGGIRRSSSKSSDNEINAAMAKANLHA